jgi:hypothetical protein
MARTKEAPAQSPEAQKKQPNLHVFFKRTKRGRPKKRRDPNDARVTPIGTKKTSARQPKPKAPKPKVVKANIRPRIKWHLEENQSMLRKAVEE